MTVEHVTQKWIFRDFLFNGMEAKKIIINNPTVDMSVVLAGKVKLAVDFVEIAVETIDETV